MKQFYLIKESQCNNKIIVFHLLTVTIFDYKAVLSVLLWIQYYFSNIQSYCVIDYVTNFSVIAVKIDKLVEKALGN